MPRPRRSARRVLALAIVPVAVAAVAGAGVRRASAGVGRVERHVIDSRSLGAKRAIRVWLPPGFPKKDVRYDVLYLNDGQNLFGSGNPETGGPGWRADATAAELIASGTIAPLVIVGIDNGGDRARGVDYLPVPDPFEAHPDPPGADRYLTFVLDDVMPYVERRYPVARGPAHTGFGGSSYGAASALYAAIAHPGVFGRLLLESPSVGVGNGVLLEQARTVHDWPERIDIGVGSEEGRGRPQPSEALSSLIQILRAAGLGDDRLRVVVQEGGRHNEDAWASRLPAALSFLFRPSPGT